MCHEIQIPGCGNNVKHLQSTWKVSYGKEIGVGER